MRKKKYRVWGEFNGYQERPKYFSRKRNAQRYAKAGNRAGGWMTLQKRKKR